MVYAVSCLSLADFLITYDPFCRGAYMPILDGTAAAIDCATLDAAMRSDWL